MIYIAMQYYNVIAPLFLFILNFVLINLGRIALEKWWKKA